MLTVVTPLLVRTNNTSVPKDGLVFEVSSKLPLSFGGGRQVRQREGLGDERYDET